MTTETMVKRLGRPDVATRLPAPPVQAHPELDQVLEGPARPTQDESPQFGDANPRLWLRRLARWMGGWLSA